MPERSARAGARGNATSAGTRTAFLAGSISLRGETMEARQLWAVAGVGLTSALTLAIVATVVSADVADKPAAAPESALALEMKYAEAQYKLAETNLRKVELTNQRFQKTVSASVIA